MIFLQKMCRILWFAALLCGGVWLHNTQALAADQKPDMEAVKQELLADPLFLSHLRDKMSVDSFNSDAIRQYLLKNPDILMEMNDILVARAARQAENSEARKQLLKENEQLLYHTPDDIILGNKDAKITFLEFFDYNCRYCKHDFSLEQKLVADNKNVKIIMKDYPILGDESLQAHIIANAVKKKAVDKYPLFHEKMMTLQGRATEESALAVAVSLGIDRAVLEQAASDQEMQNTMLRSAQIAYKLGFNYAPVFVLGDKVLGAVDVKELPRLIAEEEQKLAAQK